MSTSTAAVIIHAVFAGSSFGGAAGACARAEVERNNSENSTTPPDLLFIPASPEWCGLFYVLRMEAESAAAAIREPVLQGQADGAERDVLPRDAGFLPERDLERLLARLEFQRGEPRAVE